MFFSTKVFRIFFIALATAAIVVVAKFVLHLLGWEIIEQSSLHNSIVSSVIFVVGFLLSATIIDYKESERIPAEFAANIEDMYDDAEAIYENYPVFDLEGFRKQLRSVAIGFGKDVRRRSYDARKQIKDLSQYFSAMEAGKVPPNFIVKLKQQQTILLRARHRVNYIQRIKFIPSATVLMWSIVALVVILLLLIKTDPLYGGLAISGFISFVLVYMLVLISVISTPFHAAGETKDDVSLFLVNDAAAYLDRAKGPRQEKRKKSPSRRRK
ncbi:MAG TPA: hypothetical protein VD947_03960 [Patescibacteria group bacterium]|nr:hypothetical protein [Patescibacteria group bacterium]